MAALFDDDVIQIRWNAYSVLIYLADFKEGIERVIAFNVIQTLVDKLIFEKEESILVRILQLLQVLLEGEKAPGVVLSTPALPRLNTHLASKN